MERKSLFSSLSAVMLYFRQTRVGGAMGWVGSGWDFWSLTCGSPGLTRGGQDQQISSQWFVCSAGSFVPVQVISRGDKTAISRDELLLPDLHKNPIALHQVCLEFHQKNLMQFGVWRDRRAKAEKEQDTIFHFPHISVISVCFSQLQT